MKKSYSNIERKGLPGGPNEEINYSNLSYSTEGYKRFSPDVNNPFNIINSRNITMKDVDFPVTGIDNLGNSIMMLPEKEYQFAGNEVLEIPHKTMESLNPYYEGNHKNVHSFAGIMGDGITHMGAYGGFDTKHFGLEGSFIKPLQKIAHGHDPMSFDIRADYKGGNDKFNFNVGPTMALHGRHPSFGIQGGLRYRFQPGGELEEDMMYSQPIEDIISDRPNDSYEYKRITDPSTGISTYQQRRKGTNTWKSAGKEGSTGYRAVTNVFGDDKTGYATSPERAKFLHNQKMQYRMKDQNYIRGLIDKANHPLDLVYGNPQLGIPAFGEQIKNMPEYREDFFDPYGDQEDKYFAEYAATPQERKAAAQRARQNYLSNVGRTEEEDQAYEMAAMKRRDEEMQQWNKERQQTRMEMGRDPYTGQAVPQWEMAGYSNPDDYYNYLQTDPTQELLDATGASTTLSLLGIPEMVETAFKIEDEGLGAVGKDILNTGADLVTAPFVEGDINPLTGEKYWEGATSAMALANALPFLGALGKTGTVVKGADALLDAGITTNKLLGTASKTQNVFNKGKNVLKTAGNVYDKVIANPITKAVDVAADTKIGKGISSFNKNVMKYDLGQYIPKTGIGKVDDFGARVGTTLNKVGLSPNAWGAVTGYGMYGSKDAVGRIASGEGDLTDASKVAANFIPGANIAKAAHLPTYTTKAGIKVLDKSGLLNRKDGGEKAQDGKEQPKYNLNDLYLSPADLEFLNQNSADKGEYYCDPTGKGCLASSYDAYDKLVGQRYPSSDFATEKKIKEYAGFQSLAQPTANTPGWYHDPEKDEFVKYKAAYEEDGRFGPNTQIYKWINKYPHMVRNYYDIDGEKVPNYDFTVDSWDVHGMLVDKGGKNIYTRSDSDWKNKKNTLNDESLKRLYAQMSPGTIVGFNMYDDVQGVNATKGMANSSHSAQVIGWDERGVPVIYDYGKYTPIDSPKMYNIDDITNITIPKQSIGRNLEWAKQKGYYTGKDPQPLNLNLQRLYDEEGADIDELEPFYNALKDKKFELMDDLRLREKDYDELSKVLIGIAMKETDGGAGIQHNLEQFLPGTVGQETSGLTQLMWSNIAEDEKLKKIAKKYGITKQSDLKDSDKSAIASMIYGSRNLQAALDNLNKGKKESVRTYYPPGWKGKVKRLRGDNQTYDGNTFITEGGVEIDLLTGNNWSGIGWTKDLEDIQEQLDAASEAEGIPGRYTARKENGKILIDKKTLGNADLTPMQAFIYNWNSPNTLTSGDAQGSSGYLKKIQAYIDKIENKNIGGEVTPEDVVAKQQALEAELIKLEQYNLNPVEKAQLTEQLINTYNEIVPAKFRMGGASISPELQLYKNYVVGKDASEKAEKNYDKLNRVYYREAKLKNMSPSNFIMTNLIS